VSPIPQSTSTSVRTSTSPFRRRARPRAPCGPAASVAPVSSQFRVGRRRLRRRREKTGSGRRNVNPPGDDPQGRRRGCQWPPRPRAPMRAGRGGHWFVNAANGGAILSTTFTAGKRKYRSMQVGFCKSIMVVAEGDVRLKIKKTGSGRRIAIHRGRGSSASRDSSSATGQSQKHMFPLFYSCHRALW